MKYCYATSDEFGEELFLFPASIEPLEMVKVLGYIRHGDERNWKRVKRRHVSSGPVANHEALRLLVTQEMKYVVVNSEERGDQLFVFPKKIDHDRFAEVLSEIKETVAGKLDNFYRQPVSAGFTDGIRCHGKSETLSLSSRSQDTDMLINML
jgi:hypothetical protein